MMRPAWFRLLPSTDGRVDCILEQPCRAIFYWQQQQQQQQQTTTTTANNNMTPIRWVLGHSFQRHEMRFLTQVTSASMAWVLESEGKHRREMTLTTITDVGCLQ